MTAYRFIKPLDVLYLRGNRLFGEGPGAGEALMPPWPSVFAGALRSWMLTEAGVDTRAFGRGEASLPPELQTALGTPAEPGTFAVREATLARRAGDGSVEPLYPLPSDLQLNKSDDDAGVELRRMVPTAVPPGVRTSLPLTERIPALAQDQRVKPVSGYWLTAEGWRQYQAGETPQAGQLVPASQLWQREQRLGIGLDNNRGSAANGQLYTTEVIAPSSDVGFLVGIDGVDDGLMPRDGMIRLGGEGRGARVETIASPPEEGPEMPSTTNLRLVLRSPGVFPGGWRLPGMDHEGGWSLGGVSARCVAAAVPRPVTVSGWDLAHNAPKPAQRAVPAGAVYWVTDVEGDGADLAALADRGLWPDQELASTDKGRRAEGFNRFTVVPN